MWCKPRSIIATGWRTALSRDHSCPFPLLSLIHVHVGGNLGYLAGCNRFGNPLHALPTVEVVPTGGTSQPEWNLGDDMIAVLATLEIFAMVLADGIGKPVFGRGRDLARV